MIFYAPTGNTAPTPTTDATVEQAATARTYESSFSEGPPLDFSIEGVEGSRADITPPAQETIESFNWNNAKVNREFITLEQKVLAKKASPEETKRYQTMKRDRASGVFADRYVRDYAEVQRLKKLSEKLAEIQKYMRPIPLG